MPPAAAAGFDQGLEDGSVLAANNLSLGFWYEEEATQIRLDNAGDLFYELGDISSKIGVFAAHCAVTGLIGKGVVAVVSRGTVPVSVFYTGGGAAAAAEASAVAGQVGGTLIQGSIWGRLVGAGLLNWGEASAGFALGTRGTAHVVMGVGQTTANSIFWTVEYPILVRNGVKIIWHFF